MSISRGALAGAILRAWLVACAGVPGGAAMAGDGPSFLGLGGLPDGVPGSRAYDVTADGTMVVGVAQSEDGPVAFRWSVSGGMVALGDLPGGTYSSVATAISVSGAVVVGFSQSSNGEEAFRWTHGSGMQGLGDFPGAPFGSKATDVSANGSRIVGWGTPASGKLEAFIWSQQFGIVGLGDLPGGIHSSRAMGISGGGTHACGWGNSGPIGVNEAFLWTENGGLVGLGFMPEAFLPGSQAFDISFDGQVIVGAGWAALGYQAYRREGAGPMVALGDLPGGGTQPYSIAFAVSDDGTTVVGTGSTVLGQEAFIWTASGGMRNLRLVLEQDFDLDLAGWILREARSASITGTIITGWGSHDGLEEAFLANLTPSATGCPADINGDGLIGLNDLLAVLGAMGPCPDCDQCIADLDGDCDVDSSDLSALLALWGACP